MLALKVQKRRIIHFTKKSLLNRGKPTHPGLKEELKRFKRDWEDLFEKESLARDMKFLRRMAIAIKQLQYHAANSKDRFGGERLYHFLSTPIGETTLIEAADKYSDQDPRHSDLAELLGDVAKHGKQVLEAVSLL